MDTMLALAKVQAARARGAKLMVFDWDKAARLIVEHGCKNASAGLTDDWACTRGAVLEDGKPVPKENCLAHLASVWAAPALYFEDSDVAFDCWKYKDETPGWDAKTVWPDSALAILNSN